MRNEMSERSEMLKKIMSLQFSAIDLHLYLDTHPHDIRAITDFNRKSYELSVLKDNYEQKYGPITVGDTVHGHPWRWIEEPWPWQMEF